uniref:phosphoenolpyruvate carboxykinase (ATP) n=2 Tax=Rhizophora mucronata TaxID=61149 RepID=A0A2P2JR43_RHIMU
MTNMVLRGRSMVACSFSRPNALLPYLLSSFRQGHTHCRQLSHGLNLALAGKGVIVKDKAFRNLGTSELQEKGAAIVESLSGLPVHVRGNVLGKVSKISYPHFSKLLKQVTTHLSSISDVYVHDGAIGSSLKCSAKVRIISDSTTPILYLSKALWQTPSRAISHDSCPVMIYVASSISPAVVNALRLECQGDNGIIAADVEHYSLVLCGKAFSDINGAKEALAMLSGPIIAARGGLPLSARLLMSGDSTILLFAPEDTSQSFADQLVSADEGVIFSSQGTTPYFPSKNSSCHLSQFRTPAAVILVTSDSSGTIPSISKLCPGQAAYHFLAGHWNGKFAPAYNTSPSAVNALELAKAFMTKLKDNKIASFLINVKEGQQSVKATGSNLFTLMQSALSDDIPPFHPKGGDLQVKYNSFLSDKFPEIPEEFSF